MPIDTRPPKADPVNASLSATTVRHGDKRRTGIPAPGPEELLPSGHDGATCAVAAPATGTTSQRALAQNALSAPSGRRPGTTARTLA